MGITRKALAALVVLMAGLLGGASVALAVTPTAVVVEDRAGVLDQRTLLPAVRSTDFYEPTKVAIYTYNGTAADNLNAEVLRFARTEHPEWISADGQKWADGLFIFALDPVGRHVGTYMGEDRKVSPEQREDIQNASKELLRDAQWTDGTIAGIRRGAELINQPWYRSTAFLVTAWTAVAAAVCGAAAWLIVRWRTRVSSRKELARGDASYANVSMDLQVTELNASTIPESSRYGSTVLERHRTFVNRYNTATELSNQVHALSSRDLSRRPNLKLVRGYADAAAEYAERRDLMMSILAESGFEAAPPAGAYYVMADCSHLGLGDDVATARYLVEHVGVATVPGSSFFSRPEDGAHLVRFAFCKTLATLEAAGERLRALHGSSSD